MQSRHSFYDLQTIFNKLYDNQEVTVLFGTRESFDSLRTSLQRKLRAHKRLCEEVGAATSASEKYLCSTYDKEEGKGKFKLQSLEKKPNAPGKKFTVEEI